MFLLLVATFIVVPTPATSACTLEGTVELKSWQDGERIDPRQVVVYVNGLRDRGYRGTTHQIFQRNRQFDPQVKVVRVGDEIEFINKDHYAHDVYSANKYTAFYSHASKLDVTDRRSFKVPGPVRIGCNLHKGMRADVLVVENPWFDDTVDATGRFTIQGVPAEKLVITAWEPNGGTVTVEVAGCSGKKSLEPLVLAEQQPPPGIY